MMADTVSAASALRTELRNDLSEDIDAILKNDSQPIQQAQRAIRVCQEALAKLRDSLLRFPFSNLAERIAYYKHTEPFFLSRLIFFSRVLALETGRPPGDHTIVSTHFQTEWQYIRDFHSEHRFLCRYIRSEETWLDEKLFVPNTESPVSPHCSDQPDFLLHDASRTVAILCALDLMQDYLLRAEEDLSRPLDPKQRNIGKLTWTDSKSALIELAYAIQSAGSLNDRKASLREIIECLQATFHIDLGHYPRVFQEILSRKMGYTTYIDRLRDKLLLRIKLIEEKYDPK